MKEEIFDLGSRLRDEFPNAEVCWLESQAVFWVKINEVIVIVHGLVGQLHCSVYRGEAQVIDDVLGDCSEKFWIDDVTELNRVFRVER